MIELIPNGFIDGEPSSGSTPLRLLLKDELGQEYFVRFTFGNRFRSLMSRALRCLKPAKIVVDWSSFTGGRP